MNINSFFSSKIIVSFLLALSLTSCSLQLISDYDQKTLSQLEITAKKIDRLFIRLSYMPVHQRRFSNAVSSYMDIDVELQALKTRQELRALNELTLKQINIAISLFSQDKEKHKKQNTISDFVLKRHRKQYNRLFIAMIKGEEAKKLTQPNQ